MKKIPSLKYTAILRDGLLILMGSILYALSTVLLIFPNQLLLGGTSGISVILENLLPFSPGTILVIINSLLVILAFIILGKNMAVKTLIGSVLTTVFVGLFERLFMPANPPISNPFIASAVGAAVIAIASGIMFYADSSSGGTDIIALIVRKFIHIDIGKALLITDILIVIIGGALSGLVILISSFIGLLIKTLGIDLVISTIQRFSKKRGEK